MMMNKPSRDELKKLFKKVKKFRISPDYEEADFSYIKYYSWIDQTDNVMYTLFNYDGEMKGIRWDIVKPGNVGIRLEMCEICQKHKKTGEVGLITAETKKKPKGIYYRTRGHYACLDYRKCNQDMKDTLGVRKLYDMILGS